MTPNTPSHPHTTPKHHSRPRAWLIVLLTILPTLILLNDAAVATAEQACPNQEAREANNSTMLPDCRAYEMVTPLNKNGADISTPGQVSVLGETGVIQSTPDGSRITYHALAAFAEHPGGLPGQSQYLSSRTPTTWATQNITPPIPTLTSIINNTSLPYRAFNRTLTEGLFFNGPAGGEVPETPPLGGAPEGYADYILHNLTQPVTDNNSYQALLTTAPPYPPETFNTLRLLFEGYAATPDLHHIILKSEAELTPGVNLNGEEKNLYEWSNGHLEPVNIPPGASNNQTLPGARLGSEFGTQDHTLSDDGSTVFWSTGAGTSLYARVGVGTPQAHTLQLDQAIGGEGAFLTASSNGTKAFLTKGNEGTGDLYEYDLEKPEKEALTDLTPTETAGEAAVQGVLGASEDGNYVYFVASGELAPGAHAEHCQTVNAATGCNLYLWHAGSPMTFIARLTGADYGDWNERFALRPTRVSTDGHHVVFTSGARLTAYDNAGVQEVYEYEVGSPGPVCVSCNPSGAAPLGSSGIPGASIHLKPYSALYAPRALSADGSRVFFDSSDVLSPMASNNKQNVYEWQHTGTGSCDQPAGCISLISAGTSSEDSTFVDASENASDVFFTTRQQLTPSDTDQQVDIYDAHENGGYTTPNTPICTGTGCQGLPSPQPTFATPPTLTFEGPGNYPAPPKAAQPKKLTRAQKLTRALKACTRKPRKQRSTCQKHAHARYGPPHSTRTK